MMDVLVPLQFGVPGGMELAVILLIAVLLFGANKIPKLARSTGQAMGEFRRGHEEVKQELEEMQGEGGDGGESPDASAEEPSTSTESGDAQEEESAESEESRAES